MTAIIHMQKDTVRAAGQRWEIELALLADGSCSVYAVCGAHRTGEVFYTMAQALADAAVLLRYRWVPEPVVKRVARALPAFVQDAEAAYHAS